MKHSLQSFWRELLLREWNKSTNRGLQSEHQCKRAVSCLATPVDSPLSTQCWSWWGVLSSALLWCLLLVGQGSCTDRGGISEGVSVSLHPPQQWSLQWQEQCNNGIKWGKRQGKVEKTKTNLKLCTFPESQGNLLLLDSKLMQTLRVNKIFFKSWGLFCLVWEI